MTRSARSARVHQRDRAAGHRCTLIPPWMRRGIRPPISSRAKAGWRPSILLLHYTGMDSADRALHWLCVPESRVSCHYLIDEAGRITQMVQRGDARLARGRILLGGRDRHQFGLDRHRDPQSRAWRRTTPISPRRRCGPSRRCRCDIIARHGIAARRVLAHSDVAPGRKRDPGEKFDWARLAGAGVGHWVEPARVEGDAGLRPWR